MQRVLPSLILCCAVSGAAIACGDPGANSVYIPGTGPAQSVEPSGGGNAGQPTGTAGTNPGTDSTPVPGAGGTAVPGAGGVPLPGAGGTPVPGAGGTPLPGAGGTPLPGAGGTTVPGAGGTTVPAAGGAEVPGAGGATVPGAGGTTVPGAGGTEMLGTGGVEVPVVPADSVTFSVPSGTFEDPFTVTITTTVPGAEIRYTLDGEPLSATSGTLYDGAPLQVSGTTRITAGAFINGVAAGSAITAFYVARSVNAASELSLIVLDDYGAGPPQEDTDRDAAFLLFQPQGGTASLSAAPTVAARAAFHIRGQSSVEFDKQGYRVELRDHLGADVDHSLVGMPAESDWVLHGPFADKSLIRNAFAYSLGRDMGLVAPRFALVELYMNTDNQPLAANDYRGVYLLVESIKNSQNRLDLSQLRDTDTALPDITGGYIFKFELDVAEPPILTCTAPRGATCWVDLEVYDPSPLNSQQQNWLQTHLQSFHDTLFGDGFTDPTSGYAAYIDVDSFVNYMVLQEALRNLDAYIRSLYFYKDRDTLIFAGPLWDYNLTAGAGLVSSTQVQGWQHEIQRNGDANGWFQRLATDPAFAERLRTRYTQLRAGLLSDAMIDERIDALAAPLANPASRNFDRWPNLTQRTILVFETPTANTWQGQIEALRNWLKQRLAWLDQNF